MGEFTEVASANRAVRGVLTDRLEELEDVLGRIVTCAPFFSSEADEASGTLSISPLDVSR